MTHSKQNDRSTQHRELHIAVATPLGSSDPAVLLAAAQAGESPVLDLRANTDFATFERQVQRLQRVAGRRLCLRVEPQRAKQLAAFVETHRMQFDFLLLSCSWQAEEYGPALETLQECATTLLCEVTSVAEAERALAAGASGLLVKGNESAGRVGSETTFVLLQRLVAVCGVPLWVQGGLSPRSLAACRIAGATGALLDAQLALAQECQLPARWQFALKAMDGTETVCVGEQFETPFRVHRQFGRRTLAKLQELQPEAPEARAKFFTELRAALNSNAEDIQLVSIGQDGAFAATLAAKHRSVGGILRAYRRQSTDNLRSAAQAMALREQSPLAQAHGTRYPIVQGPMTRVSDVAGFALAVAQEGGLPFLALALLRETAAQQMLQQTAAALGDAPWGVGILGFVPGEIRAEQLRAVLGVKPRFAILAGGRPDQAKQLDAAGITTYIHTPSPRLLEMFLKEGARRFVFEGRECGGHIGPLASFVLWDLSLEVLLKFQAANGAREPIDILFAGGVHDALSAAMVAALAAQAAEANIRIGVLSGTAYLFTHEAVESGAIVPEFQEQALLCAETIILDSEGGHATRCAPTAFQAQFNAAKRALQQSGQPPEKMRHELEELNIGRLRIASKGIMRTTDAAGNSTLSEVPLEQQQAEGLYMIGQVAALRSDLCTIQDLHHDISAGSCEILEQLLDTCSAPRWGTPSNPATPEPVAIIGMACLYPGAPDISTFWQNILKRHNAIREVPRHRWDAERFYSPDRSSREHVISKWGGFIEPVAFDPMRYGIPPTAIQSVEPLQLLMLEVVRRALCDSGYEARPLPRERTAVIVGSGGMPCDTGGMYETRTLLAHYITQLTELSVEVRETVIRALRKRLPAMTEDSFAGVLANVLAGRVANRFDFGGPNFTVDAACGSSLAALDCAVQELRQGSSDVAVVGAADGAQNLFGYQLFNSAGALSPRGQCRPFDKTADGIAISDGVASIILKRLSDAVRDGDRIYSVIRHVAASSDGRDKSLTAPSVRGQRRALQRAYAPLEFDPSHVGLIEAHGTGTVAGDRAELTTLQGVFRDAQVPPQQCALGSVKSLIGHTKNAAGLAGVIKCALALHHRVLPPTLFEEPNPTLLDRAQPFYLLQRPRAWFQSRNNLRRAGVSAFGFGGTNFHALLEEYAPDATAPGVRDAELMVFRGRDAAHLAEQLDALRTRIEGLRRTTLVELAAALQTAAATTQGEQRLAIVTTSREDLQQQLATCSKQLRAGGALPASGPIAYAAQATWSAGSTAFLFPGQGSQYVHMLEPLALNFNVVREQFEQAEAALSEILPAPLLGTIFPPPAYTPQEEAEQRQRLSQTWYTQPALGAADYAMFSLLTELGVQADFTAGHSYGEYVALCAAGVLTFQDLIRLSEARGRVVNETQGQGAVAMLAVMLGREQLQPLLAGHPGVSLAIVNTPHQCTVGGKTEAIAQLAQQLEKSGVTHRRLPMSAGFHIPEAFAAAALFARITAPVQFATPRLPVYCGLTAEAYPSDAGNIRRILLDQLTKTVRFKDQIEGLYQAGARTFIEVGPGNVLSGLVQQILEGRPATVLTTNRSNSGNAMADFLTAMARLYVSGAPLALDKLYSGCRVSGRPLAELEPAEAAPSALLHWVDTGSARLANGQAPAEAPEIRIAPSMPAPSVAASAPTSVVPSMVAAGSMAAASHGMPGLAAVAAARNESHAMPNLLQDFLQEYAQREAEAQRARESLLNRFLAQQSAMFAPVGAAVVAALGNGMGNGHGNGLGNGHGNGSGNGHGNGVGNGHSNGFGNGHTNGLHAFSNGSNGFASGPMGYATNDAASPMSARTEPVETWARPTTPPPAPALRVVTPPAPAANGHARPGAPSQDCEVTLLELVSERTGYPREMLQLDQNMEADLGIDSIKRTEIFGALRDRLGLQQDATGTESFFSAAGRLRTLREVAQWLNRQIEANAPAAVASHAPPAPTLATPSPVTPPAVAQTVPTATAAPQVVTGPRDSHTMVLDVVSQRTGYPREMLQLDQNMEAELGIDSIKRTEIFSALREQLPSGRNADAEAFFSATSRLRTLREVMQWLDAQLQEQPGAARAAPAPQPSAPAETSAPVRELRPAALDTHVIAGVDAKRYVVRTQAADLPGIRPLSITFQRHDWSDLQRIAKFVTSRQWGVVLITEDSTPRAEAIATALNKSDAPMRVALLRHGPQARARKFGCYEADLTSPQSLHELRQLLNQDLGPVSDLWHLLALEAGTEQSSSFEVRSLFTLATVFGADICAARGTLIAVTEMDGALGVTGTPRFNPGQAAVPGLIKSIAQEWPAAMVRCWDTAPGTAAEVIYFQAFQEFSASANHASPTLEVGYSARGRCILANEEAVTNPSTAGAVKLNADSVILVTGGARGIAAHVAQKLTAEYGCSVIITGRSAPPPPESPHTAHLHDPTEIKRALTQQREVTLTPKELKSQYERLMAAREMQATFASLRAAARHFEYHSLDVRDAQGLKALVEDIYRRHGRLDGVIHAAGIVDDTLVLGKSMAAFDAVYDTKVTPALALAEVLRPQSLQFLAFFSSVAARFGCSGGADYAAANEVLNKLSWQLNRDWPGRVVSIGWGPWSDVGLATRYSEQMHTERGFGWLPVEAGCQYFVDELRYGAKSDAEVVIYVPNGTGPEQAVQRALGG